jgi:hypothetical protein
MNDGAAVLIIFLLIALTWLWPSKYDPSIRFKEWLDRNRR